MGLDGVELVLSVEEEFGIAIDDKDAEHVTTPKLLAEYVISRLGEMDSQLGRCLTQSGFYRIRSVLVREFGAKRKDVRPDSVILDFLKGNIRAQWSALRKATGASHLPHLECRKRIAYPLLWGLPLAGAILAISMQFSVTFLLLIPIIFWTLALYIVDQLGDVVPAHVRTVGAIVPYVRIENKAQWTPDYVLQKVIQITSEQLGFPIEKIQPDHHFVKDLGMD